MVPAGHAAKIDKGKKYEKHREPIMIYLFVSQQENNAVETYLAINRYFDYTGLLVFPMVPFGHGRTRSRTSTSKARSSSGTTRTSASLRSALALFSSA